MRGGTESGREAEKKRADGVRPTPDAEAADFVGADGPGGVDEPPDAEGERQRDLQAEVDQPVLSADDPRDRFAFALARALADAKIKKPLIFARGVDKARPTVVGWLSGKALPRTEADVVKCEKFLKLDEGSLLDPYRVSHRARQEKSRWNEPGLTVDASPAPTTPQTGGRPERAPDRPTRSRRFKFIAVSAIAAALALASLIAAQLGPQKDGQSAAPQSPRPTLDQPVDRPTVPPSNDATPTSSPGGIAPIGPELGPEPSPADVGALLPPPPSAPTPAPAPDTPRATSTIVQKSPPVPSVTSPVTSRTVESAPAVIETFDGGSGGWTVIGHAFAEYKPTGGNTGGFVSATDDPKGTTWYWEAPRNFLGKQSVYGRSLTFDLMQSGTSNNINTWDLFLYGFNGTVLVLDLAKNPDTSWTPYSIRLDDRSGWVKVASGRPSATAEDMQGVLGNMKYLRIRGEFEGGSIPDIGGLDNVVLGA